MIPSKLPERLAGRLVTLDRWETATDAPELWAGVNVPGGLPAVYLAAAPHPASLTEFIAWVGPRAARGVIQYAVRDNAGQVIGMTAVNWVADGEAHLGGTLFIPAVRGSAAVKETRLLILDSMFGRPGVDVVSWHTKSGNTRSHRALLNLGATRVNEPVGRPDLARFELTHRDYDTVRPALLTAAGRSSLQSDAAAGYRV